MNKIKIKKDIEDIQSDYPITWKDIKDLQLEDDDEISIGYEEPYYSENNSWDGFYYCRVERLVEETDEQFQKRQSDIERDKKWAKERRYENYLKLKTEFEDGKQ